MLSPLGSTLDALAVMDWRRRMSELYTDIRRISVEDPAAAHEYWVAGRNALFAEHPASPLRPAARSVFSGLTVAPYNLDFRFELRVHSTLPQCMEVSTGTDGVIPLDRIGKVQLDDSNAGIRADDTSHTLAVWALRGYGGGIFLPIKDHTSGTTTYSGGRYLLDTVKGVDLGQGAAGGLIVDFNFSYNPSCAYDPAWACPLASRGNVLDLDLPVGELLPDPGLVVDGHDHNVRVGTTNYHGIDDANT